MGWMVKRRRWSAGKFMAWIAAIDLARFRDDNAALLFVLTEAERESFRDAPGLFSEALGFMAYQNATMAPRGWEGACGALGAKFDMAMRRLERLEDYAARDAEKGLSRRADPGLASKDMTRWTEEDQSRARLLGWFLYPLADYKPVLRPKGWSKMTPQEIAVVELRFHANAKVGEPTCAKAAAFIAQQIARPQLGRRSWYPMARYRCQRYT
jgi:hypothetical protein